MSDQDHPQDGPDAADPDAAESRAENRVALWMHGATLREPGCTAAPVKVQDLSRNGFRTEWPYRLQRDATVYLKLPGFESMTATVAWCDNFVVGCKFDRPLSELIFERLAAANRATD